MTDEYEVKLDNNETVRKILRLVYEAKIAINLAKEETGNMAGVCECPNCLNESLEYYYDGDNSTGDCKKCNFKI